MTPVAKAKAVQYGLTVAGLGFVTGVMLNCYCPGWFVASAIAAVFPIVYGSRLARFVGVCLAVVSIAMAVDHFQHQRAQSARLKAAHERFRAPK